MHGRPSGRSRSRRRSPPTDVHVFPGVKQPQSADPLGACGRWLSSCRWTRRSAIRRRIRRLTRRTPRVVVRTADPAVSGAAPSGTGRARVSRSAARPRRTTCGVPPRTLADQAVRPQASRETRTGTGDVARSARFSLSQRAVEQRAMTITRNVARTNPTALAIGQVMMPTPVTAAGVPAHESPQCRTDGSASGRRRPDRCAPPPHRRPVGGRERADTPGVRP
jgi:hypothetical protein